MSTRRVVVVGAGIAGLTAAHFLQRRGHRPIVLESSDRVGGRMRTERVGGFTVDVGAQFLMKGYPVLLGLAADLGFGSSIHPIAGSAGTARGGKIRRTRMDAPLSPVTEGLLTLPGFLRLAVRGVQLARRVRALPSNDFGAWAAYDDAEAEPWARSFLGREVTDYVAEPLVHALFLQPLGGNSRAFALHVLDRFLFRRQRTLAVVGGMDALPRRIASGLDVRLGTPVRSLSIGEAGVEVAVDGETIRAERVILAAPAAVSRSLYRDPGPLERELLGTPYSSTVTVAVAVKDSFRLDPRLADVYGFMIPRTERDVITAITAEERKDRGRLGDGKLFLVFLSGQARPGLIDWNDDEIVAVVLAEMERYLPGVSRSILFTKVYRLKDGLAFSPVGRSRNVAAYRRSVNPRTKVFFAGDYMGMPYTEGAAESGKWAAETLAGYLAHG
jgi:oxygen-dependent protoporphyrinogen oxidase